MRTCYLGVLLILLTGCAGSAASSAPPSAATLAPTSTPVATLAPTSVPTALARPSPTVVPSAAPTATPSPSPTEVPTPAPSPTPDPVAGLTISDLRARAYGGGEISIGELWNDAAGYTSYRISYPADGLRLTGLIHIPDGEGPFPLIIANRGHIDKERYQPGMDSRALADFMARNGYLVVAPDYRGYAGGDDGPNLFYTGFYADILNLVPLAQALPQARPGKVGMWGHSRGASITVAAATISDQIAAAVVYAPAPADLAEDYRRRYAQSGGNPGSETWPFPPEANPDAYRRVSPINHFEFVTTPIMLHHGTADTVVDASASVAIAEALRAAGKDVTLHLYEGGGHTLVGEQDAVYLQRTLEFFRAHGL
jgi:uncharacterized protein